jgi:predicted dehydrogenase
MNRIGVGIIGASPLNPGWAVIAHIPALRALPDYELRAVSTSNAKSAEAAANAFGVPAFDNHNDLIAYPGIDLVVVSVKLPYHHELIMAAIAAGKMVFSEWPLGSGLAEAQDLTDRTVAAGLRTAIGLQARFSPAIQHARKLIRAGYIGEVLATTLVGSGIGWGPETDRAHAYVYDALNGATTLTVPTLHALDALNFMLGDFASVGARLGTGRRTVYLKDEGKSLPVTAPDQLAIFGGLQSGATASIFYRGGVSRGSNLHWEINGSEGDLVLSSPIGNVQVADLKLSGGCGADAEVAELVIPGPSLAGGIPEAPGGNVLRLYAQFAEDIRNGTNIAPDFAHALRQHRVIAAIQKASASGQVQAIEL